MRILGTIALALVGCNSGKDEVDGTGGTGATGETADTGTITTPVARYNVIGDASNLPAAAVLSIWGSSSSDVWLVGSDPNDGLGPIVYHYDGAAWTRLATGTTGDLWWVWSDGGDTLLMSGNGGRMVTYTRSTDTFSEQVVTDPTYKLFGTWGTSTSDVWTVGGDVNGGLPGVMVHSDGATWTDTFTAPVDPDDGVTKRQTFKVWGAASDDVWFVGTNALLLHWDGVALDTSYDSLVYHSIPFVTMHGRAADDAYVVGGDGNGTILHWDGAAWSDESPAITAIAPPFNGVFASDAGKTAACGLRGSIWWRDDTAGWAADTRPTGTARDFHACWIDETGEAWAVGGDLTGRTEAVVVTGNSSIPPI